MGQGKFIRIPLLIGANSDEGTSFGVSGLDNETAIFNNLLVYRSYAISPPTARKLLELYPNDPAHDPPYYITNATIFPSKGLQWRRDCAIAGDIVMISGRRKTCEEYTSGGLPVFSYRFDTPLWNAAVTAGTFTVPSRLSNFNLTLSRSTTFRQRRFQLPKHIWCPWSATQVSELHRLKPQHWEGVHLFRQRPQSKHEQR